jgi:hypothetical protein
MYNEFKPCSLRAVCWLLWDGVEGEDNNKLEMSLLILACSALLANGMNTCLHNVGCRTDKVERDWYVQCTLLIPEASMKAWTAPEAWKNIKTVHIYI